MKMLDRYIGRIIITHTLVVFSILLAIYFFSTLVNELGYVGKGTYSTTKAVIYSIMLLPRQAYELFPMVALLGTMLGLGSLATTSELTVMRASGISVKRIAMAVVKAGLLMIVVVIAVGEGIAPKLEKEAHVQRIKAIAQSISLNAGEGLWAKDGDSFISIRRLDPGGKAKGVTLYRLKGQQLAEIAVAASGRYRDGIWHLNKVRKTLFSQKRVKIERVPEMQWKSNLTPDVINLATMAPENLAAWELYDFIGYLKENGLASQRYEVAMWIRLITPLATGGMILLALPFVFGSMRAVGVGQRIMIGALIGIAFYLVNGVFSRIGLIYEIPPIVSAGTPTMMVYLTWFWMMRRLN